MEETKNWRSEYSKLSQRIKMTFDFVNMLPGNTGIKTSSNSLGACLNGNFTLFESLSLY